jgi:hypothetical protein
MFKGSVPLLGGDLAERLLRPADAGVVHQHVEPAERRRRPLDDAPAARDLPEIARRRHRPFPLPEPFERRGDGGRAAAVHRHPRAGGEERLDRRPPDPPGSAGYEDSFAC